MKKLKQKKLSPLYLYHIETQDGIGSFNFFTQSQNHKKALRQLQTNSFDYKRLVSNNKDLVITIKKLC